jgi:hypothetical protein
MAEIPERKSRQIGGELIIPAIAVVFVVYYFTTIWNSPWTAQVSAFLIGGILLLCCGLFFARCAMMVSRDEANLGMGGLISIDDVRTGRLWLLLATLGFCILIDRLGFTLTTFLFLWVSMMALGHGARPGLITLTSALMALGGWAVFIWTFDTRFPRGWFETTMAAVLGNG